jgi:regulator of replication initiation timing
LRPALAFKNSAARKLYLKLPHTTFRMVGRIRLISLVVLLILLPGSLKASATPFELAHDDGNAGYGWSDFYPYAAAIRFSPPSGSWRITGIRLHAMWVLRGTSQVFYVQIWDAGLNTRYWSAFLPSSVFKNATLDWHTIRLPNVVVTGVFYVVIVPMFTLDGSQLWISIDEDPPIANNSFIVNVDDHTILTSLNATSKRPGDFMVRVIGEPVPTPPELKLSSIEFKEDETVVAFTYPGESLSFGARLIKPDGSFTEENVTRFGNSLIVRTRGEGLLNIFVVTPSYETIGSSVRLENGLRKLYGDLLANYTALKHSIGDMASQINSLLKDNEDLRLQLSQSQALIRIQDDRINELLGNVSSLSSELEKARTEVSGLRGENTLLKIGLALAIIVSFFLGFLEVRRRWGGK